ncbi:MAG: hypothetical protein KF845_06745 [Cyclobacteriaceae bacterium]|nr:hypothetical protein [Cyclobacteriaceae bacterium]
MKRLIWATIIPVIASCNVGGSGENTQNGLWLQLGKEHSIPGHHTMISYESITYDSRCPSDVVCIWGGFAVAKFKIVRNNKPDFFELSTETGGDSNEIVIYNYRIKLLDLLPYPKIHGTPPEQSDYKAEVLITLL